MENHQLFVERLDAALASRRLSGRKLDAACDFADSTTSKIRRRKLRLQPKHVSAIARAPKVDPLELLAGTGYEGILAEQEAISQSPLADALAEIDQLRAEHASARTVRDMLESEVEELRKSLRLQANEAELLAAKCNGLHETNKGQARQLRDLAEENGELHLELLELDAVKARADEAKRQRDAWRAEAIRLQGIVSDLRSRIPPALAGALGAGVVGLVTLALTSE